MKEMDIVFLLDRSGSMNGIESDTIGGYNGYLNSMKDKNVKVTTVLFDDKYEMITNRVNIKDVKKLDDKVYYTRGCTALYDAIGKTISFMDKNRPNKVLFVITTDGYENASIKYNRDKIKELILGHKNYEFIYLGADIDSYSEASKIGISSSRTSNYKKDNKGMCRVFNCVKNLSESYYNDEDISSNWKNELE